MSGGDPGKAGRMIIHIAFAFGCVLYAHLCCLPQGMGHKCCPV